MVQQNGRTFEDMQSRLEQIVEEVGAEDISLDDALALYEEAVKLGLAACDLSESDVEAYLAASSATVCGGSETDETQSDQPGNEALAADSVTAQVGAPDGKGPDAFAPGASSGAGDAIAQEG